jgi:threonine dehydrogenase-like Zn-dependent dehydrogenase
MKAVTCQGRELRLVDRPTPEPGAGQVVVSVIGCSICGSGLHVRQHAGAEAAVLAVICMLKARGVATVAASGPSAGRRRLAGARGADIAVGQGEASPYQAAGDHGFLATVPAAAGRALGTVVTAGVRTGALRPPRPG